MSDHNWVLENLESYSAGGLNAEERERLETHLPECSSCSQALQDIRASDQQLESLFAPVRPKPGFEDRMISSLRTASAKNGFRLPMIGWIGASAAAAVVVGVVGASMERVVLHGSLLPETGPMSANNLKEIGLPYHDFHAEEADQEQYHEPSKTRAKQGPLNNGSLPPGFVSGFQPVPNPMFAPGGSFGGGGGSFGGGQFGGGGFGGNLSGGRGGEGRQGQPVDKMAEALSEKHLSQLGDSQSADIDDDGKLSKRSIRSTPHFAGVEEYFDGDTTLQSPRNKVVDNSGSMKGKDDLPKVGMEGMLANKTRGVAIAVDATPSAGGFVQPGSHVDVIHTDREKGKPDSKVVLENVLVRGIDQQPVRPEDKASAISSTVTLEVTPEQALKLSQEKQTGKLSVLLRPFGDNSKIEGGKPAPPSGEDKPTDGKDGKEAGRDIYTYRNDQPAATPPTGPRGGAPGAGWGALPGGMGGGGGMMGQMMGRMMGGMAAPSGGPAGAGGGKGEGKSTDNYYRPAEQAAAELEKYKDKGDKKSEAGRGQASGEDKPTAVTKRVRTVADLALPVEQEKPAKQDTPPAAMRKIIIRTGDIEFEVDSFDSAVATVTLLVNKLPGAFVATVNSEKLPNGKVRGSMVVRTPPEHLDTLVLDMRKELGKNGELKGQKIGSQDITKQYTDTESRLKAARAMENRLLEIIKTGKGEIKDLLVAEKELGVWRTKIEEYEGEKRYYDNQVALSTLTITLAEKEIRSPFALIETERVQVGVEVEDVIKAQQAALKAIDDAKGRVTKSELKQHAADQLTATIHFEVAPDKAGPMRDRIEQLGRRTRLDVDRLQETEGGAGEPSGVSRRVLPEIKTRRKDTQFFLNLYNVANVAPRETVSLNLACVDTEDAYKKILARVEKATGRVVASNLNRQRNDQTTGLVQFEVKSADAEAVLLDVRELGEVMRLQTTENPDVQNATRSKRGFIVQLFALGTVAPRETATIQLASKDVPAGYRSLLDAVNKAKGRVLNSQLNEQDKQNITANLDFEIRRPDEAAITKAMSDVGDIYSRTIARAQDSDTVIDSKVRYTVSLINQARIPPRETVTLGIEVNDVDKTAADFTAQAAAAKGRTAESHIARERSGRMTAKLIYDVPLASAPDLVEKFSRAGTVRVQQFSKNQQVPESDLAIARLDVTLSNSPLIVPSDEGFGLELRKGLATSVRVLSLSLSWLVFGLLVILPWVLVVYAIYRLVVRLRGKPSPA